MVRSSEFERKIEETSPQLDLSHIPEILRTFFTIDSYDEISASIVSVSPEGKVSVRGDCIRRIGRKKDRLPISFEEVRYDFNIKNMGLITLKGCPNKIGRDFSCEGNQITSLVGGPIKVGGHYSCLWNELSSLEGLPLTAAVFNVSWNANLPLLRLVAANFRSNIQGCFGVADIMYDYHGKGTDRKNILACQKALIDAGFEGNASW